MILCIITLGFLSGCGTMNHNFDYIKDGNVKSVVIQSVRDKNFKFIVTDKTVLEDFYQLLSKGKEAEESTSLSPDYIFEINLKDKSVKKYYYVVGLDKESKGNLYNNEEKYIIPKRIDNDLLKNFYNIRTPINFKGVYYEAIMKALNEFEDLDKFDSINVCISEDRVAAKFILSTEENEFKERLQKKSKKINLNKILDKSNLDVVVKTVGYKSKIIKMEVAFKERKTELYKLYIIGNYIDKQWILDISDEKQNEF